MISQTAVAYALDRVRRHCPGIIWNQEKPDNGNITWSFDCMVIRVFPDRIEQRKALVSDFRFSPPLVVPDDTLTPKYHEADGKGDPYARIDRAEEVKAYPGDTKTWNYCDDGR